MSMQEFDVQITIQRALKKYPDCKPRIISDNGSQFISKDFAEYLRQLGLKHIRTTFTYQQRNGKFEPYLDNTRNQISNFVDF